jgi:tRNA-Thr(GGU) m(6)t(6)A37 methyltransferase TsaA
MQIEPIGIIHSCFKDKFGVPRQPRLSPSSFASLVMKKEYSNPQAFQGLEGIKHLWLITGFHLNQGWRPQVKAPRLGGNKSIGLFSTRSPFRPNGLGLSLVDLKGIKTHQGITSIEITNHDLVEGTPVYDIKPYHYLYENITLEHNHWFSTPVEKKFAVEISKDVKNRLQTLKKQRLCQLLEETLCYDPRPQYKNDQDSKHYFVNYDDIEFEWKINNDHILVLGMKELKI